MEQTTESRLINGNKDGVRTAMNILFCSFTSIFAITFDYWLLAVVLPYMIVLVYAGVVINDRPVTQLMRRANLVCEILVTLILVNMGIKNHIIWTLMIPYMIMTMQISYLIGKRKKEQHT